MKPSIGRIVHYIAANHVGDDAVQPAGAHYAAIITHVWSDVCVNLSVFAKGGPMDPSDSGVKTSILFDEAAKNRSSWHWPEREV